MTTTHQQEAQAMRAELSRSRTDAEAAVDGAAERIVHEAGPWTLREHESMYGDYQTIHRPDGQPIDQRLGSPVGRANRRLIAAAPDLYAALLGVAEWMDRNNSINLPKSFLAVRAALAKASPR